MVPSELHPPDQRQHEARILKTAACHGNPVRAWKALQGPGLAPATAATWESAKQKLSPSSDPVRTWQPPVVQNDVVTIPMLDKRIKTLRLGRAFDIGGWCHEQIQVLWQVNDLQPFFHSWLHFSYGVPDDKNGELRGMLTSRLVCLAKPSSTQVRPLLLQPCWMKVLHGSLLAALFELSKPLLEGIQLGVGRSNAATVLHGTLQHALQEHDTPLIIRLDIANAFSSIDRFALARVLSRLLPHEEYKVWMPWVENILCQPMWLVPPAGVSGEWWSTQQGVAQGNPLSAWLFSCALTLTLRETCATSAAKFVGYIDDTILYGSAADIDCLWPLLEPALAQLGLLLQPAKSLAFSPLKEDAQRLAPRVASHVESWTDQGIEICGHALADCSEVIPTGGDLYINTWLHRHLERIDAWLQKLLSLEPLLGCHSKALVSHMILVTFPARVLHLLRGIAEHHIASFVEELDSLLRRTWATLFQLPFLNACQWRLLCCNRSYGDFGFRSCYDLAAIARVTSLAQSPTEGAAAPYFQACFEREVAALALRVDCGPSHSVLALVRQSFHATDVTSVKSLQRRLCALLDRQNARTLATELAAAHPVMEYHMLNLWAVESLDSAPDQKGMASWFDSLPCSADACVNNEEWLFGVHQRLGCPVPGSDGECMRIKTNGARCAKPLDATGIHASHCAWNLVIRRHNSVRDIVSSLAKLSGSVVQIEQRISDVSYSPTCPRPIHTADIHITEPCGAAIVLDIRTTSRPLGQDIDCWLKQCEVEKRREYGFVNPTIPSDVHGQLRPFVVESSGRLGPCARAVVKHLVDLAILHQQNLAPLSRSAAMKRVAVSFQKRVACTLLRLRYRAAVVCSRLSSTAEVCHFDLPQPLLNHDDHAAMSDDVVLSAPAVEHAAAAMPSSVVPAVEHADGAGACNTPSLPLPQPCTLEQPREHLRPVTLHDELAALLPSHSSGSGDDAHSPSDGELTPVLSDGGTLLTGERREEWLRMSAAAAG